LQPEEPSASTITVVVMGVSGSGKTTVARQLVDLLGWPFAEGDDFHPPANVAKMRSGTGLTDADRGPWLEAVARWIGEQESAGRSAIATCSALKRAYRTALRRDHPSVWFVHVTSVPDALQHRLETRGGHYMPASLLASQLEILEPLRPD
jgi:gluconokinase